MQSFMGKLSSCWKAGAGIWKSFFVTSLLHTHLHYHVKDPSCTKLDLLVYILENTISGGISDNEEIVAPDLYDFIVIDGGALIHSLPGTTVQGKTFDSYFDRTSASMMNLSKLVLVDRYGLYMDTTVVLKWSIFRKKNIFP